MKQNLAEVLKGIKIDEFETVLGPGKKPVIGSLLQMESTLNVTEV